MSQSNDGIDWTLTTWEGSRRAQLRRWLALTVRERLQAIEEMTDLFGRLSDTKARTNPTASTAPPADDAK